MLAHEQNGKCFFRMLSVNFPEQLRLILLKGKFRLLAYSHLFQEYPVIFGEKNGKDMVRITDQIRQFSSLYHIFFM